MLLTIKQEERRQALLELLVLPDPPDIHRGYRYTLSRDSRRNPDEIKRDLGTAYIEYRKQDYGQDISCVISVRKQPTLRMVRRA